MKLSERIEKLKDAGLFIGALYFSELAKDSGNHFLINHGADVSIPFATYFGSKILCPGMSSACRGMQVFLACSLGEIAQKIGFYPGTYDAKDFIAYAAGSALAAGLDYIASKKKPKEKEK